VLVEVVLFPRDVAGEGLLIVVVVAVVAASLRRRPMALAPRRTSPFLFPLKNPLLGPLMISLLKRLRFLRPLLKLLSPPLLKARLGRACSARTLSQRLLPRLPLLSHLNLLNLSLLLKLPPPPSQSPNPSPHLLRTKPLPSSNKPHPLCPILL
jgi:hypothetical protein